MFRTILFVLIYHRYKLLDATEIMNLYFTWNKSGAGYTHEKSDLLRSLGWRGEEGGVID